MESICGDSKRIHKRVQIIQDQKLLSYTIKKWMDPLIQIRVAPFIKQNWLKYFANNTKNMCCCVCFADQHRHCSNFNWIDETVKNLNKDEIKDKLISLSSLLTCISKLQEQKKIQNDALCTLKEIICFVSLFCQDDWRNQNVSRPLPWDIE